MTIDSSTGVISWSPASTQVGTHPVTVRVTDDNPAAVNEQQLSDTVTFEVTITGEGSTLTISRLAGNLMQLTITGDIGLDYELQISTDIVKWVNLIEFRLTTSPHLYIDPASASESVRIYRLRIVP